MSVPSVAAQLTAQTGADLSQSESQSAAKCLDASDFPSVSRAQIVEFLEEARTRLTAAIA
jgi:hypothetical protein